MSFSLIAQTHEVCENGDCSAAFLKININHPLETTTPSAQRTADFKAAYQEVQRLKTQHSQSVSWPKKYKAWKLHGVNCLKMYQLEGLFAHEYEQNPDFKAFIKTQEAHVDTFRFNGFRSARKAVNLRHRMKTHCPEELDNIDKSTKPTLETLSPVHMTLGKIHGYFDAQGNPVTPGSTASNIAKLQNQLNRLPIGPKAQQSVNQLGNALNGLQKGINTLSGGPSGPASRLGSLASGAQNLLSKLGGIMDLLNALKGGKNGILPSTGLLGRINNLIQKGTKIKGTIDQLVNKTGILKGLWGKLTKKGNDLKAQVDNQTQKLNSIKMTLEVLNDTRYQLQQTLQNPPKNLDDVTNAIQDITQKADDVMDQVGQLKAEKDKLQALLKDLQKEKEDFLAQLQEAEDKLKALTAQQDELEDDAQEAENDFNKEVELQETTQELQESYGKDLKIEPVEVEEWAESFQVERPYWEAIFHPDNEVVDGYVGRYFELQFKDADKQLKLLFGPGEYFLEKSDFRKTYGPTMGTFVTEALHHMKQADQAKVVLFIQGSADIAGHNTFRGNLDPHYAYSEVSVLPQKDDQETFGSQPTSKTIPEKQFTNEHLPDLRGNYLKEMISAYSKKLNPVLLEGKVQSFTDEQERNAVIYLFFPEEVLEE